MRLMISLAALFLSVILLQLGLQSVLPFDAVSGMALGFSAGQVGLLGSAHFLGFFVGCWWAPRLMGEVGHSRAFAAFTAAGTIGVLAHMMVADPWAWAVMRIATGLATAGCYTIIEAWMQSKVNNANRGRVVGIYRVVDITGSLAAQLLIGVLTPAAYLSYNVLALLCCAALFPMVLTRAEAPQTGLAPRLRPWLAWERSPLAAVAVVASGVTISAFRSIGPVYGIEVGLNTEMVALFLGAFVVGGGVAQFPVGWLADRYDRRKVVIWLAVATVASCLLAIGVEDLGAEAVLIAAAIFGLASYPVFSVAAAHAHDHAAADERVELSAALMFLYAVGAIASPLAAAWLVDAFGPGAMFALIALVNAVLAGWGVLRLRARASPEARTAYTYVPRTSFLIGRLLGRGREEGAPKDDGAP